MDAQLKCPICTHDKWTSIEKYKYGKKDMTREIKVSRFESMWSKIAAPLRKIVYARPRKKLVQSRVNSAYDKLRREVLFNVWFPSQDTVILTSKYCDHCGLATFFPRPTDDDISKKYNYLKEKESNFNEENHSNTKALKLDKRRADRIYNSSMHFLDNEKIMVLDYGGANGKLMKPFIDAGHEAFLVDYNNKPIDGVTKLSDDLANYSSDKRFDLIICSHVLEHVSRIGYLIRFLKNQLKDNGIIYAEVPYEVWAGISLEFDPVTHLNFYTENSFKNLFLSQGLKILDAQRQIASYGSKHIDVIWIIAQNHNADTLETVEPDIEDKLFPSRMYSLKEFQKKISMKRM